jgi:membrane protease YdiL (CAAX protease family)
MLSEKPWKLDSLLMLGLSLLLGIGFFSLAAGFLGQYGGGKVDDNSTLLLLLRSLALDGSILISIFFFLRLERLSWADAFGFRTPGIGRALLWGFVLAVLFSPVGQGMNELCARGLEHFNVPVPNEQAVDTLQKAAPGFNRIYLIVFAVLIAPVAEETLFRGILYPSIKQYGFPRAALWGTSFLFALIHLSLTAFLPLMLFAILLAMLYEKTSNLLACIVAHSLFNASAIVLMFYLTRETPVTHPPY